MAEVYHISSSPSSTRQYVYYFLYKQTIDFSFLYKNCTMSHFCYYVYRVMCQAEAVKSSCDGRQQDTAQENS